MVVTSPFPRHSLHKTLNLYVDLTANENAKAVHKQVLFRTPRHTPNLFRVGRNGKTTR